MPDTQAAPLPLDGVTILAVEQYGAGPFGSMLLGDLGAEVIKIENPAEGGDISRGVGPHFHGPGDSHFYQAFNRNKRSIGIDLKQPEGQAVFRSLVAHADAVYDNLRGDLPAKLRLTYADLRDANPAIVCAHLSAYGRDGPRAAWPGYDFLMQAEAGYLSLSGEPDGPPARCGVSIIDMMTGAMASLALVAALVGARATGRGRDVDVNLFDTALHNLTYQAAWHLGAGDVPTRQKRGAHLSLSPSQLYRTRDGWIFLMCQKEKFFRLLCDRIGRPDLAADPRFDSFATRLANRDALTEALDAALTARDTAEWMEVLGGTVPAAPVLDVAQALANPFVRERGGVAEFERREGGPPVTMLASPLRFGDAAPPRHAAPALGADTAEVLSRIGIDDDRLQELRARRIVT
ncbi:CaiB/BaiF CoA transferase family protein [Falsiroseomonas sp. CW058]|uniref:CaiB/BaiF CoA transferase family protein n=1 Tax=Falsiroseomonas sp. CW058 TaxID=3388664 RepID=UPI003D3173D4